MLQSLFFIQCHIYDSNKFIVNEVKSKHFCVRFITDPRIPVHLPAFLSSFLFSCLNYYIESQWSSNVGRLYWLDQQSLASTTQDK